jgi:hypothetical protein
LGDRASVDRTLIAGGDEELPLMSRKIRLSAPMINIETDQFWKKIGSRESPAIDEFRSEFFGGYFV